MDTASTARYAISVTVTVAFNATDAADAASVATRIEDSISVATPLGRGAELTRFSASKPRVVA